MIQDFLQANREEGRIENAYEDTRATPGETSICISAPIDDGSGSVSPGEYGTTVCFERQGVEFRLASESDKSVGWGFGVVGSAIDIPRGFQDISSGCIDEQSRSRIFSGSVTSIEVEHRLAPVTGAMRFDWDIVDRWRRLLRPIGFQRPITVRPEGDHVICGVAFYSRAPPWRQS
jgi:hypothetical protein